MIAACAPESDEKSLVSSTASTIPVLVFTNRTIDTLILVYGSARNNLDDDSAPSNVILDDLNEMEYFVSELRASGNDVIFYCALDNKKMTNLYPGGLFYPVQDRTLSVIPYRLYYDSARDNVGDPDTFIELMKFVNERYTYARVVLVLWNHGGAFYPMAQNNSYSNDVAPYRYVGLDEKYYDALSEDEQAYMISRSFAAGKVDVLAYNACNMGVLECLYTVRNSADWIVASPMAISIRGFPFDYICSNIAAGESRLTDAELVRMMADEFNRFYIENGYPQFFTSAYKTPEAIDGTVAIMDDLVTAAITNGDYETLKDEFRSLMSDAGAAGLYLPYYDKDSYSYEVWMSANGLFNRLAYRLGGTFGFISNRYAEISHDSNVMYCPVSNTLSFRYYYGFWKALDSYYDEDAHNRTNILLFYEHTNTFLLLNELYYYED